MISQTLSSIGPYNNKYVFFFIDKINNGAGLPKNKGKAKFGFNFPSNIVKYQSGQVMVMSTHTFPYVFKFPSYGRFGIFDYKDGSNYVAFNSQILSTSDKSWESIKSSKCKLDNFSNKPSILEFFTRGNKYIMLLS